MIEAPSAALWPPPAGYVAVPSRVEGIEVFAPAPAQADERSRSYRCRQCGGAIAFDPGVQQLTCPFCGAEQALDVARVGRSAEQFEFTLEALARAETGWGEARRELVCEACGAAVAVPPDLLTSTCAFCGSQRVLARDVTPDTLRPTALVPFALERDQMRTLVSEWLGRGWMHPPELRQVQALQDLVGIYLPYWVFNVAVRADWRAEVGTASTERYRAGREWRTRTVIHWRWRSGRVELPVEDLLVPGTERVSAILLGRLAPFDMHGLVDYHLGVLAGWQAKAYDLQLPRAWDAAKGEIRERAKRACQRDIASAHVRNFRMSADFADERWRYVLLPVYLASYAFEGKMYHVAVNGQNGRVAGQKPVLWLRVWLAIAALLLPGACLGLAGMLTVALGGIGAVGLALGFVLLVAGAVGAVVVFRKARAAEEL